MAWLTKSRFMAGRQCHKRLWSEIHAPLESRTEDSIQLMNGREVDDLVRRLNPGPVVSRELGMPAAITETTRLMAASTPSVLHQPAFRVRDLAVIADMLRHENGRFTLVEVKSSTSLKPEHLPDVGYQTLVLQQAGIPVAAARLAHVNNRFVLKSHGDYEGLIVEEDVTAEVEASLPQLADEAAQYLTVMASTTVPAVTIGGHCNEPYACPFIERCLGEAGPEPEYPVSLLPRGGKTLDALISDGYEDLTVVPAERLTAEMHQRVHRATVSGQPYFDATATQDLRAHPYPRSYLDFETMGYAVPQFIGSRPYEQLPFQYSLHVEHSATDIRHHERLDINSFGDFHAFAAQLTADVPTTGPVYAYNAGFEKKVLLWLAANLPAHSKALTAIADRLVDLWPITRNAYYHRDMRGSWSIKKVLPTIAPALDYKHLDGVRAGDAAQLALIEASQPSTSAERRAQIAEQLRAYCRHDTWAMVVLRRFLCDEPEPVTDRPPAAFQATTSSR